MRTYLPSNEWLDGRVATRRILDNVDPHHGFFWTSGADGKLRMMRCDDCGYFVHPPGPVCPRCLTWTMNAAPTSGRGTIYSFTVNCKPWDVEIESPYAIGIIQLDDQDDLRLAANIVTEDLQSIVIGAVVTVEFETVATDRFGTTTAYVPFFRTEVGPS